MEFFALIQSSRKNRQIWCVEDELAYRVEVQNPKGNSNTHLKLMAGKPLVEQFREAYPFWDDLVLEKLSLKPGQYFSRMARPIHQHPSDYGRFPTHSLYKSEAAQSVGQLESLAYNLKDIFRTLEPSDKNLDSFGHSIRECLIIAAMEVESHWKNTLSANGFKSAKTSTNDYVELKNVMKLDEYAVQLIGYPKLQKQQPFVGWDSEKPTQTLPFFNAYNQVKHDRESCFHIASLRHAIQAVSACYIMIFAQFGYSSVVRRSSILMQMFNLEQKPNWNVGDCYTVSGDGWPAEEVSYFDWVQAQ